MAIKVLEKSLPWAPALRTSMSRLMYAFEASVRSRSGGKVTLFVDDALVTRDDDTNALLFTMGKVPDLFEWDDERDRRFDVDITVTLFLNHMVDSKVDLYHLGEKEPFATFPLKMDSFADDLAVVVPEIFPNVTNAQNQKSS